MSESVGHEHGENLRRALDAFEDHVERCRFCRGYRKADGTMAQACAHGHELWRVVELRTKPDAEIAGLYRAGFAVRLAALPAHRD